MPLLDPFDGDSDGPAKTWIFQANPEIYDLATALKHLESLTFSVRQHRDDVAAGDQVLLWESGADGGLLAVGAIQTNPQEMEENPKERAFYTRPSERIQIASPSGIALTGNANGSCE
ncbi:MAG: hypothetical protein ACYC0X_31500 [Pirellulaceae bacterium]